MPNFKHINNEKDVIPIVPGRFLGFTHPAGEVHIVSPGNAVSCPGMCSCEVQDVLVVIYFHGIGDDDATDDQCTIKTVPNIFESNILNHVSSEPCSSCAE